VGKEQEITESKHPVFDKVLKFVGVVGEFGGSASDWASPADPGLAARSPQEITQWLQQRLTQVSEHEVATRRPLFGAELRACARAAIALREKDTPNAKAGDLRDERFRVLSRALSLALSRKVPSTVGIAAEMQAYAEDYPEERARYCTLLVDYLRALVSVATQVSHTYWTVAEPGGFESSREFVDALQSEGRVFLCERIKKVYDANRSHRGGAYAAIHLAKCYWYDVPEGRPKAAALIAKHKRTWEEDDELWETALALLGEVVRPITLKWFEVTDTGGGKWSVDDLKGKTTMLCFFWRAQRGLFQPTQHFASRGIQVIGVPLDEAIGEGAPFAAVADPRTTDIARLKKLFRLTSKTLPHSVLVTPTLEVLETRQRIAEYISTHFPEDEDGGEVPSPDEPNAPDR